MLLQREIPEEVNARVAAIAREAHVPVLLDCGGVEGPISPELMHNITTLSPNETELARLTGEELGAVIATCQHSAIVGRSRGRLATCKPCAHSAQAALAGLQ